jgi:DNA polymerase-3 subunit delta
MRSYNAWMDAFAFIQRKPSGKPQPVYVVHGDEDFLKRQALAALRRWIAGGDEGGMGYSSYPGDKADFATIHDELRTLPFLSTSRLVVVDNADPFVTKHREALEKYVKSPAEHGVLALEVKSWPSNTRLAKAIEGAAVLVCKSLAPHKLPDWCVQWAQTNHGKQLTVPAAKLLVDLVGAEMGLLDQELAKLAIYVGDAAKIDAPDVDRLVGSSREENTFKIFDAIGNGQAGEALTILDRLFDQGEDAMAVLGAFSYQLRRLAQIARSHQQGMPVGVAMERAGVPPFAQRGCEQQLRHIGLRRANRLYDWLLETDIGMKGGSQLPPRTLLERLVVRLARKNA